MHHWYFLLLCAITLSLVHGQTEILVNPGFEQALGSEWTCSGCAGSRSNNAQSGSKSFRATQRTAAWQGPIQTLPLGTDIQPATSYHFTGYVKVLQASGQKFLATIVYTKPDGTYQYDTVAYVVNVASTDGWVLIDVDYTTLNIGQTEMKLYIEGPDAGVNFLVDSLSLKFNQLTAYNILENPGFEDSLGDSWYCSGGCAGTRVDDAHSGSKAYKASGRTSGAWQGPIQTLPLGTDIQPATSYHFTGYVKVLNSASETVLATIVYTTADGGYQYDTVAYLADVGALDGWILMEADYVTLDVGQTGMKLYLEGPNIGVNFQVDSLSLTSSGTATTTPSHSTVTTPTSSGILDNPGFEGSLNGNWFCNGGCTGTRVNNAHSGSKAYQASNRGNYWEGPRQTLPLGTKIFAGSYYYFSGYVKILQSVANQDPQRVSTTLAYTLSDGSIDYSGISSALDVLPSDGWIHITGDFVVSDNGETAMDLYIEGPDAGIDFLVDSLKLTEIATDPVWRTDAHERIENIRKGTLEIQIKAKETKGNLTLMITQDRHEFGFGTAVAGDILDTNEKYREWFLNNFEYAVLENDLKWRQTEYSEGTFTYDNAMKGLSISHSNGIPVRGHTILWADEQFNPPWVQQITDPTTMYNKAMKRINDLLGHFNGSLIHWDVNNEMIANSFYMDEYNSDPTIRYDMFKEARRVDPSAKLFLNDYNVVASGQWTDRYIRQAQEFLAAGAPVDGMGVQSHLSGTPSGAVLLNRLDRLSVAGLPIWITELDYANSDVNIRADILEDALLAYFSHPNVYGVLFWGFWDGRHWRGSDASLVDGPELVENKAGEMWQRLFHDDWRSTETVKVKRVKKGKDYKTSKQAFYGEYSVKVTTEEGEVLASEQVTLSKVSGSATVELNI